MPCWPKDVSRALKSGGFRQESWFFAGDFQVASLDDQVSVLVLTGKHVDIRDCLERSGFTVWHGTSRVLLVERD